MRTLRFAGLQPASVSLAEIRCCFISLPSKAGGPSLAMVGGSLLLRNNFTEGETSLNRAEGTTANMLIVLYLFTITQTNLPWHFQCDLNIPSYDGSVLRTQNLPSIKTLRISIDTFLRRKACIKGITLFYIIFRLFFLCQVYL